MRQRIKFGLILWLITKSLLAGPNTGAPFAIPNDSKHLKINIAMQRDSLSSSPTDCMECLYRAMSVKRF